MIDTILLLLLFFILTTKFTSEDLAIRAVLPTDQGNGQTKQVVVPPPIARVVVTPDAAGAQLRIGGGEPIPLPQADFDQAPGPQLDAAFTRLQQAVADRLASYEVAGRRHEQIPIEVHAYSHLAWRYALTAFDAVRAYEQGRGASEADQRDLRMAASPRTGDELAFLAALK